MANPFFNAAYYLARNPDVAAAGYTLATAQQHYDQHGAAELRAPNPWFDARAYLAAYPDLVAHGVTLATAFAHYTSYGINEGRAPAANLNPANFSYIDYATANPDLRTIFGIADPAHLTSGQEHALLAHFLAYGYLEGRPGVSATDGNGFFAAFGQAPPVQGGGAPPLPSDDHGTVVDGTHVSKIYIGTAAADAFTGTQAHLEGVTLQGLGGSDALTATSLTGPLNVTLNSVETIQAGLAGDATLAVTDTTVIAGPESGLATISLTSNSHAFTYGGAPVGAFVLNDNANLTYHTSALAGSNDVLALGLANGVTSTVLVDGGGGAIEHYNVTYAGAGNLALSAGNVDGGVLTVNLLGGSAGNADSFTLNGGTAAIQTVIVDGSAGAGNQTIAIDPSFSAANATVKGGSGNDRLNLALAGNASDVTVSGVETLHVALSASSAGALVVHGADLGTLDVDGKGFGLSYTGNKVGAIILESGGNLNYALANELSGATDALAVVIGADTSSSLTVRPQVLNGVDTYNLAFNGNGAFVLDDHGVNAPTLTVNVASVAGANVVLGVGVNTGLGVLPSGLAAVKIDGSGGAGNQTITLSAGLAGIDAEVQGGSGNDVLAGVALAGHVSTLNGGAGSDTLNASAGRDTMTGGAQADKFQFAAGTAAFIGSPTAATVDAITDFQAGDTLTLAGSAHIDVATGTWPGALSHSNGLIVLDPGVGLNLAQIVSVAQAASLPNAAYLFQFGADSYFLNTGDVSGNTAQLVKLANTTVSNLQLTNGGAGVQYVMPSIIVNGANTYTGTDGDDVFQFNGALASLDGVIVNGLANNDTFVASLTSGSGNVSLTLNDVENLNVTAPGYLGQFNVAGSGLRTITVGGGNELFIYSGANVETVHLVSSADMIAISPTNTPGANDGLTVLVDDNVTSRINVNGIERVDLALGANTNINLTFGGGDSNTVASLTVTGGATNSTLMVAAPVASSGSLTSIVVDASAVTGNQTISFDPTWGGNFNATVTGGGGNDTLSTLTDASHTATLIGGAGADILNASAGRDTMTGGPGADTFQFALNTANAIGSATPTTVDTITDFQVGDTLNVAGGAFIDASAGTWLGVLTHNNGVIVLDPGVPFYLAHIVAVAQSSSHANSVYLFQSGADTYFLNTGGSSDDLQVIKLANTNASDLHFTNGGAGVEYIPRPIVINPAGVYAGSAANDVFTGEYTNVNGSTIQGLGGIDTLNINYAAAGSVGVNVSAVEKIAVTLAGVDGQLTVLGTGVKSVSLAAQGRTFAYQGGKIDAFTLLDDSITTVDFNAGVGGSADTLSLATALATATTTNSFTANGIEHYNITLTGQSASLDFGADSVSGGALSVVVTGGGVGAMGAITMHSANSVGLNTVTLDASSYVGGFQYLDIDSSMASATVFMTGSAGDDSLTTATDAAHNDTRDGGLGNDWIYGSLGIDTMIGGGGNDVFYFRFYDGDGKSRVDNGVVVTDQIVDFSFGDQIQFGFTATHIDATRTLAGVGAGTNDGIFVFQTPPATLTAAQTALNGLGSNVNVVFKLADGSVYYLNTLGVGSTADDTIVKLVGVDITQLTVTDLGVHYTGAPV